MWVRSKYTSELAVLAAWVSLLVPWNVTYHGDAPAGGSVYFFRFALFELQFRRPGVLEINDQVVEASEPLALTYPGTELVASIFATTPPGSMSFYDGTLQQASLLWTLSAVAFALAFALSIALYLRTEETISRLPVSEVRLMGGLLGLATLGTAGASYLYYLDRDVAGVPIPVGVLVMGALSLALLVTKEVPDAEGA